MKRGLKGFAFLVSGLVLGIIGATASVTDSEVNRRCFAIKFSSIA